jgi:hypothetical protein
MATQNKFGLTANRQIRFALKADKWLDEEAQMITTMISQWEYVSESRMALYNITGDPSLYLQTILITNKCIDDVSRILDEMWKDIADAQRIHAQNVKRVRAAVMAIKD